MCIHTLHNARLHAGNHNHIFQEVSMQEHHKILLASALFAMTNLTWAQGTITAPPDASTTAPAATAGSGTSGSTDTTSGSSAAGSSGVTVGTGAATPATSTATNPAASGSVDPYVQRREARKQAKAEYKESKKVARQEYKQDKKEANATLKAARTQDKPESDTTTSGASGK